MGKKDLAAFLIKLSTNAKLHARYMKDPDGTTAAAGLSSADRAALRGASAATLEDYLGEEPAAIVKTPIVKGAAAATRIVKRPIVKKPIVKKPIVKTAKTAIVKTSIVKTTKTGKGKPKK
ncbi:MAG: hypothetical protein ABI609_01745 [Acidobacteriota bacterium]